MWHPKYSGQLCLVCSDPLDRRKSTDGAVCAFPWDMLLLDEEEDAR